MMDRDLCTSAEPVKKTAKTEQMDRTMTARERLEAAVNDATERGLADFAKLPLDLTVSDGRALLARPAVTVEEVAEMIVSDLQRQAGQFRALIDYPTSREEINFVTDVKRRVEGLTFDGFLSPSELAQAIAGRG